MDDGAPTLEVGFTIDTSTSFSELIQLQQAMDTTEAKIVAEAAKIEKATGGMVKATTATASIRTFGSEATRELATIAREKRNTERAGEAMIRQLDREAAALGKTREQLREAKVETLALAAAEQKNTDLADRLLSAARNRQFAAQAAAEAEAAAAAKAAASMELEQQAIREAANAYRMFEAVAKQKSAAFAQRQSQEAQALRDAQAQAAAADRLRAALDPTVAAQQRYNREMAEARTLISAGKITLDEYAGKLRLERTALADSVEQHNRSTAAAVKLRMAMQGASYQTQDFFTQVSMGANPINAFAVQGAQLAGQFSEIEGKAGDVARFFMGPWGLAITAGLLVFSPLVMQLLEGNKALDDAVDKLKKDARETQINRQAKELFIRTQEGVRQSLLDATEANNKWIESQRTAAKQAAITARANELAMQSALADNERRLAAAQQRLKGLTGPGGSDARLAPARDSVAAEVAYLTKMIADQRQVLDQLSYKTRQTYADLAEEAAKTANDPIERIKRLYEGENGLIAQAKKRLINEKATSEEMGRQLGLLNRQEQAAIEAAQRELALKRSATNDNRQSGRSISLTDAEQIVRDIGGVITSTTRSFEQQRVLYERYLAGKGPLAAKPGTSDHEVGNALDVAKTPGMSLAKIRQAFQAQGVAIKQLLDEGSHFHVAWKKGADTAAAASKALADTQAELIQKFDPAAAALIEYRKALASIAAAKLDPATATRYADAAKDAFIAARAAAFTLPSMDDIRPAAEDEKASEKAAAEFQKNVIQPLKDELALYGLIGAARDQAALDLEREAFLAANAAEGPAIALARWQEYYAAKKALIDKDAAAEREAAAIRQMADDFDRMVDQARAAGDAISRAFGKAGNAIGDVVDVLGSYQAHQAEIARRGKELGWDQARIASENRQLQLESMTAITGAAKNLFKEHSAGYEAMAAAEKAFAVVQLANTAVNLAAGAAKMFATLGPWAFPAVAAMVAVMAGFGFAGGGSSKKPEPASTGTGTVFGNSSAQSESLKNALNALKEVDTLTNSYAREMSHSLKSIDSQISGFTSVILRTGNINASAGVTEGFKMDGTGSLLKGIITGGGILTKIPVIGGIIGGIGSLIGSLFGSTTKVTASGLYGGSQSLGSILSGGFDASYYSDITKTKKFLGITTGHSYSTQYSNADPALEGQFTLILRSFADAISAAAGPLGEATATVEARLSSFVVSIGKIDLQGLTGEQIQEKLSAIFGAAADGMANAAFPGIAQFQKVGEGAFETLVRVASTVEQVSASLDLLGRNATSLSIAAKLGLADQFDSVSAMADAVNAYFQTYYSQEEQAAAKTAQFATVFQSLGVAMPATLASFRALVEAQDLTTAAGQATYATLLQLAPAFAELQTSMAGAKSAADILSERQDLERQLLELQGNTEAIRQLDLAKLDASNRALQLQIWAVQDAQEAAKAADELREAWKSVGDSIMDEVKRIRGLNDATGSNAFASLLGQFNVATEKARGGDLDAAKSLPQLSQALLASAADAATSRQELARVQAQTAASLEETYGLIGKINSSSAALSASALVAAAGAATQASSSSAQESSNAALAAKLDELRGEVVQLRSDNNAGHAATAGNTGAIKRKLEDVTAQSGGDAISTMAAA